MVRREPSSDTPQSIPTHRVFSRHSVTRNDDQLPLGNIRLAAAKNSRSADRNAGRRACRRRTVSSWRSTTISSSFDAVDRNRRQTNLENTLKHDVAKGNHGTSSKTAGKGRYFTQTGLKHPSGCVVRSGGEDDVCCGHLKGDSSELALRVKKIHAAWN